MINNDLYFSTYINAAKKFVEAEKSGASLEKFNFSVNEVCAGCLQNIYPPKKVLQCSVCKAALYCSPEVSNRAFSLFFILKKFTKENNFDAVSVRETRLEIFCVKWEASQRNMRRK